MQKTLKHTVEFSFHCKLNCPLTAVVIAHTLTSSTVISTVFLKGIQDIEVSWRKNESDRDKVNFCLLLERTNIVTVRTTNHLKINQLIRHIAIFWTKIYIELLPHRYLGISVLPFHIWKQMAYPFQWLYDKKLHNWFWFSDLSVLYSCGKNS